MTHTLRLISGMLESSIAASGILARFGMTFHKIQEPQGNLDLPSAHVYDIFKESSGGPPGI